MLECHREVFSNQPCIFYTSDLPETNGVIIGTFVDDIVDLTVDKNPILAFENLQKSQYHIMVKKMAHQG